MGYNILVYQDNIKLANFGLSKRIQEISKQSIKNVFGVIPYTDPKRFSGDEILYLLNKKSDVYSIGVLLWEISSCQPPFYVEGELYDISLVMRILNGIKEKIIPSTPIDYSNLYTECWDGEPDNRPDMNQVVIKLRAMITKTTTIIENFQTDEQKKELSSEIIKPSSNLSTTITENFPTDEQKQKLSFNSKPTTTVNITRNELYIRE